MGIYPDRNSFSFKTFFYTFKFPKNEWALGVCVCVCRGGGGGGVGRREQDTVNNMHILEIYKPQKGSEPKNKEWVSPS